MSFEFVIRRAFPQDAADIIAAINSVAAEGYWLATMAYTPTTSWERALHHPDAHCDHLLLVPQTENGIVGWCRVFPKQPCASTTVADIGIGVLKEMRHQGIGYALISEAMDWSRRRGFKKLTLNTFVTNFPARSLFTKVGFRPSDFNFNQGIFSQQYFLGIHMEIAL